jgi:DNA replication and repair protein RecF
MVVSGELTKDDDSRVTLGVEYGGTDGRLRMRVGGRAISRLAELAALLPLVTLHQESHRVFTEGPRYRRQFLDWGLFHVEHRFLPAWQRYRRALRQRNRELQQSGQYTGAWDKEMVLTGEEIDDLRQQQLRRLLPVFQEFSALLRVDGEISASYRRGWPKDLAYDAVLREAVSGDRAIGHTRYGPHRADILFRLDGTPVKDRLSRGQLKVLVYALVLAQASTFHASTGKRCVILMDDLSAELDDCHVAALMERIGRLGLQVFITSSENRLSLHLKDAHKVFHVEHGQLTEMV